MKPQDALLNITCDLCRIEDWKDSAFSRGPIKRAVALLWGQMTLSERKAFIGRLDEDLRLVKAVAVSEGMQADIEMTKIIKGWPQVLANVPDEQRGFALSIMKKRGKDGWWPSDAQAEVMLRLWKERAVDGALEVTE